MGLQLAVCKIALSTFRTPASVIWKYREGHTTRRSYLYLFAYLYEGVPGGETSTQTCAQFHTDWDVQSKCECYIQVNTQFHTFYFLHCICTSPDLSIRLVSVWNPCLCTWSPCYLVVSDISLCCMEPNHGQKDWSFEIKLYQTFEVETRFWCWDATRYWHFFTFKIIIFFYSSLSYIFFFRFNFLSLASKLLFSFRLYFFRFRLMALAW